MRRTVAVALIATLVALSAPPVRSGENTLKLVRVPVSGPAEAQLLFNRFDETHNHREGWIELLLWPGDEAALTALGFRYTVVEHDVVARDRAARLASPLVTVSLPGPDRDDYRRLDDYENEMRTLAAEHPRLVKLLSFPLPSREGRDVLGVEIAHRVRAPDGRPVLYIDGLHHAREWPSGEYPMIFAHHLVARFGKDERVTRLLRSARIIVVPVVNPDGFDYSRESLVQAQGAASLPLAVLGLEAYWRKNRRSFSEVTVPVVRRNPDAYGVDPNRNYGFMWGDAGGGSSGLPVDQTYRGDGPFSEPETRNVRRLLRNRNVTLVITNHTYGRLVLRAWGHTAEDAPDETMLRTLGHRMATAMGGYSNQKGIGLYATTGTTDDWAYAATAALGYTFEHGTAFHPPYSTSVGTEHRGIIEAFMLAGEAAADPRTHAVVQGCVVDAGAPARARITIRRVARTPLGRNNPAGRPAIPDRITYRFRTSPAGCFVLHVPPSTRPIARGREAYEVSIAGATGGTATRRVVARRGERVRLGTVDLSR